jgi:hypothetical protein
MAQRNDAGILPAVDPDGARPPLTRYPVISVLCVYENPLFLDRICRYLEQDGDVFVEISVSAEDALHLMTYIRFDVVVTDCAIEGSGGYALIESVRKKGKQVPFICFSRSGGIVPIIDAPEGPGRVWSLAFGDGPDKSTFKELTRLIRKVAGPV